jgi:hypothetical protein
MGLGRWIHLHRLPGPHRKGVERGHQAPWPPPHELGHGPDPLGLHRAIGLPWPIGDAQAQANAASAHQTIVTETSTGPFLG